MKLIKQIEIAYFRSVYKITLDDLQSTNILFGRNDSGKSNVLRALNLFFNNETNPGQEFTLERDLCHARRAEATPTRDIRKFVYVKIWFAPPVSWKASLGETVWVKKQWSVTFASEPVLTSSITESRRQQYLTRFLNQIQFHYIPAIKDRRIFEQLLGKIYGVVASDGTFAASLTNFAVALKERTNELTSGLLGKIGVNSVIAPPDDLTDLFRSLDFETNTESGDAYSLTLQRGDGIQVRHIPAILAFLSDRSNLDFHIWGFEEPENSLELANAIDEAKLFCDYGNQSNKQIFLTSHSPAFFSLEQPDVARFFISRSEQHEQRLASKVKPISVEDMPGELMGETPHLPIISNYLRTADEQIRKLRQEQVELQTLLDGHAQSIVFVEGESDKIILNAAWEIIVGAARTFDFEAGGGTTKMESLAKDGKVLTTLAPNRKILAIVDNDFEGRNLYSNSRLRDGGYWAVNNSSKVHWCRLPFATDFKEFMERTGIEKSYWPGSLENLFSISTKEEAEAAGVLQLNDSPHSELLNPACFPKIANFLVQRERYFVLSITPESKVDFADWIATKAVTSPEIFEPLRPVIQGIREILAVDTSGEV